MRSRVTLRPNRLKMNVSLRRDQRGLGRETTCQRPAMTIFQRLVKITLTEFMMVTVFCQPVVRPAFSEPVFLKIKFPTCRWPNLSRKTCQSFGNQSVFGRASINDQSSSLNHDVRRLDFLNRLSLCSVNGLYRWTFAFTRTIEHGINEK